MLDRRSFDSIQYLRAYAALIVAASHVDLLPAGYFGVDLFFVVSGFVMAMTVDTNMAGATSFLIARFTRVAPIYYLFMAIALLLNLVMPVDTVAPVGQITVGRILESISFVNFAHEGPVYAVGWTLNFEFMFYLICGVAIAVVKVRTRRLTRIALTTALVSLTGFVLLPEHAYAVLLEFVMGLGVYVFFADARCQANAPGLVGLVVFALGAVTPWFVFQAGMQPHWPFSLDRVVVFGIPSTAVLTICIWTEKTRKIPRITILQKLGDASYSMYLSHCIVFALGAGIFTLGFPRQLASAALMVIVALASLQIHRYIELPLISVSRRVLGYRQSENRGPQRGSTITRDNLSASASDHISYPAPDK